MQLSNIWLPKKLELIMQRMKGAELNYGMKTPLLVHSDLSIIDYAGQYISESFLKYRKLQPKHKDPLKVLLVQNFVTGCTVLINRPLADAALPIPENAVFHDWWLALIAAAMGRIIFEPSPTVLYREHDSNVVGPKGFYTRKNISRVTKLKDLEQEIAFTIKQVQALKDHLIDLSDQSQTDFLEDYQRAVYNGGSVALIKMRKYGTKKMGWIRNAIFAILLIKGGYKRYLSNN